MDVPPFVADLEAPLFGFTLRSPIPRGRLLGIECPKLPSGVALILGKHIPGQNELEDLALPILAEDALSYIGEPLGLLVGPDLSDLEDLAARCVIKTESEEPLLGLAEYPEEAAFAKRSFTFGDIGEAFGKAVSVVEGVYATGIQEHWYAEPMGALAVWNRGNILIRTATQWPFHARRSVVAALDMPEDLITVEPTRIGIHLEGKLWYPSLLACHAALASLIMRRTVKIMLSRGEDFRYSPKRNESEIRIRTALGERGEILGSEIRAAANLGAYPALGDEILDRICLGALGTYKRPSLDLRGIGALTNVPPGGPLGGSGMSQGFFAIERQASIIADSLHINPLEWRKENLITRRNALASGLSLGDKRPWAKGPGDKSTGDKTSEDRIPGDRIPGDKSPGGIAPRSTTSLAEVLDAAAAMGDYQRKWASYEILKMARRREGAPKFEALRGIGVASAYQSGGFLYYGADEGAYQVKLTLDKDGGLEIVTSAIFSNQHYIPLWRNAAAEILSLDPEAVEVSNGNTDEVPDSGPSGLSRNISEITSLIEQACLDIRSQRFRDPLPITVIRSYEPRKKEIWNNRVIDESGFERLAWGAAAVEVSVDPIECIPEIRGVYFAVNGGRIISETRARNSLKLGIIQALGWASQENLSYEEGRITDRSYRRYRTPNLRDIPPISLQFLWDGEAGPRGIGELPFSCVPAAYVQAVSQAMDYPFTRIPLLPDDIWRSLQPKNSEEQV